MRKATRPPAKDRELLRALARVQQSLPREQGSKRIASAATRATQLPLDAYFEDRFFEIDSLLLRSSWLVVGHTTEVRNPGDYVTLDLARDRVIVVRGADLELHAFLDGCPHRGTPLVPITSDPVARGCLTHLEMRCPYHGLKLDLTGRLSGEPPSWMRLSRDRLVPVRVGAQHGFVFVCLNPDSQPLEEAMSPSPPWLDRAAMHALALGRRTVHTVLANWKLLVENFQESQHFGCVHPSLEAKTPWSRSSSIDFGSAFLGGNMDIVASAETVSEDGLLHGRPFIAAPEDRRTVGDALLFPTWLTSLQPDYFLSYRLIPTSATSTVVIADIFFHASAFTSHFDPSPVYRFWDRTNAEDRAICELQQKGLRYRTNRPGALSHVEDGIHLFDLKVANFYLSQIGRSKE